MNNNNENLDVNVKIKEKKVYLADNKNDMYQKSSVSYLKDQIIKSSLYTYNRTKPNDKELKKFIVYVDKRVKPNKSKNDLNYRIESLYNYIVSLYSDYIDLINIIAEEQQTNES